MSIDRLMERPSEQATLTVSMDLTEGGRDPQVESEMILNPTEARKTFGLFNTWNGMPLSNRARLFNGKRENPNKWCDLAIDGFSIPPLEEEADQWWNLIQKSSKPGLLVKALTQNGRSYTLDWRQHQPDPCLLYYIENVFRRTVKNIGLETPPAASNARLDPSIYKCHDQKLQAWFYQDYAPRVAACFTHRPITEDYFIDLQKAELIPFERESKGRALFGAVNYDILKKARRAIEDRHQ